MDLRFVYITARDLEEARRLGRVLVEERLCACVNILGDMNSFYWWDGKLQEDNEAVLIAKTRADLLADLIARVKALHSYQVPCVVALPILDGNPDYLRWLDQEVSLDRPSRIG